jgi:hypothetical protein
MAIRAFKLLHGVHIQNDVETKKERVYAATDPKNNLVKSPHDLVKLHPNKFAAADDPDDIEELQRRIDEAIARKRAREEAESVSTSEDDAAVGAGSAASGVG